MKTKLIGGEVILNYWLTKILFFCAKIKFLSKKNYLAIKNYLIMSQSLFLSAPINKKNKRKSDAWDDVKEIAGFFHCLHCKEKLFPVKNAKANRIVSHLAEKCISTNRHDMCMKSHFQPRVTDVEQARFDEKIAMWVYETGTSFYRLENSKLLDAIKILRPGAKLPSRRKLATDLLDKCYEKMVVDVGDILAGRSLCLTTDGWTNTCGFPVINYEAISGDIGIHLESNYTNDISHNSEFLSEDISRVIEMYKELDICGVVMDNTNANKKAWKLLEQKYPEKFFQGCVCHTLHLMFSDLLKDIPWFQEVVRDCKNISSFFINSHAYKSKLVKIIDEKKLPSLVIPGKTRWGSLYECLFNYNSLENDIYDIVSKREFLMDISSSQRKKRIEIQSAVMKENFVSNLKKSLEVTKPLALKLKEFQNNSVPVSEVYYFFQNIEKIYSVMNSLSSLELPLVLNIIRNRFNFIYGDAHGIGYILDPKYCGKDMDYETKEAVEEFIYKYAGEDNYSKTVEELSNYYTYCDSINKSKKLELYLSGKIPLINFWKCDSRFLNLRVLAIRVFSLVVSSSQSERNFSDNGFIHSKLRNKLKDQRIKKLLFIYSNSKCLRKLVFKEHGENDFNEELLEMQSLEITADQI